MTHFRTANAPLPRLPHLPHLSALLSLALLPLLLPGKAAATDGAIWTATHHGDISYLPLENLRSFYKLIPKPTATDALCTVGNPDISISFGPGKRELTLGGYRCLLTHPLQRNSSGELLISKVDMVKLIDPILRPTYIAERRTVHTIILDPGHGGHDVGNQTPYAREADVTLLLARQLKEELTRRGYEVTLTHEQSQYLSDQQRLEFANRVDHPIFISLHLNKGRSDTQGIETYSLAPAAPGEAPRPGNAHDAANIALAFALHTSLVGSTGARDGGCRRARYSLLSSLNCPAALVELGYATNKEEGTRLSSEEYRSKLVTALAQGIDTFAKALAPEASLKPQGEAEPDTPPSTYTAEPLPPPQTNSAKSGGKGASGKGASSPSSSPKGTGRRAGRGADRKPAASSSSSRRGRRQ